MKKFIIITSIFPPTEAVKKFAKISEWQLIVVGDKKTPLNWKLKNVIYLSPNKQLKLFPKIAKSLPWNSYSRKNLGYLYAIKQDADIIADTDDDNIPYSNWGNNLSFESQFNTVDGKGFVNAYKYFTNEFIWPRGYPLDKILRNTERKIIPKKQKVGVWQFLADSDPDVDAIYRLTINKMVKFIKNKPIVLEKNTICPFNTQNTVVIKKLFPLLFLPPFVSIRFVDILRGLVAQPLIWQLGFRLGFDQATVIQKRNPHNFLKDFELEIPMYLNSEKVVLITNKAIKPKDTLTKNLMNVYTALYKKHIVTKKVLTALKLWLEEIEYEKI